MFQFCLINTLPLMHQSVFKDFIKISLPKNNNADGSVQDNFEQVLCGILAENKTGFYSSSKQQNTEPKIFICYSV